VALTPGIRALGPATGAIHVRTSREGVAAKLGHDLLIAFPRWSGRLVVDGGDPATVRIDVVVDVGSVEVLDGTGGAARLSPDERRDITATARRLLDADHDSRATFTSVTAVGPAASGPLAGTLTLHDRSGPVSLAVVETGPMSWHATATVVQSAFGIEPYRAFFGALRLADEVLVEVALDLSGVGDTAVAGG
jgi:polyisoprenoid-binding protein YceI